MIDRLDEFFSSRPRALWVFTAFAIAGLYSPILDYAPNESAFWLFFTGVFLLLACVPLSIALVFSKERSERWHGIAFLTLFAVLTAWAAVAISQSGAFD